MPKIGRYTYPALTLDEAISYVKVLHEKCGGEARRETFSEAVRKRGGRFNVIVGALSDWGLVETGGGRIKETELAKRILFGITQEEREKAREEAARRVQLFVDVTERYPQGATAEQFMIYLRDSSGADLEKIKEESSRAYKIYSSVLNYFKRAAQPEAPKGAVGAVEVRQTVAAETKPTAALLAQLRYDEPEAIVAGLLKQGAYDLAKAFIDFIKEKRGKTAEGGGQG